MKRGFGLLLLCAASAAFADHIPVAPQGVVELQGRTQLITTLDNLDLLAEGLGRLENENLAFGYRSLTVGAYFRVLPNLKLGAFYRLQAGARHDDDWVPNTPAPPGWVWEDTTGRLEHVAMLDVSPRFQLGSPGADTWVLMVKNRFIYDFTVDQMSFLVRPELTYFLIVDRVPILNASLSYEMYFPLNFGSTFLYEAYPYLTFLWHATPEIGVELGGAYKTTVWSTSASEAISPGTPYTVLYRRWEISLGAVISLTF
jgi:hypothetical protein